MSDQSPLCPKCNYEYTYNDGAIWICPDCAHEWNLVEATTSSSETSNIVKDTNGAELKDGDTVTIIKDLKIKGSSSSIKVGTKVKGIRLNPDSADGHNISCKVPGHGSMGLKSEFVKKA